MTRKFITLLAILATSLGATAQRYYSDRQIDRLFHEADRVIYEANRTMQYDGYRPPRPAESIRYTDEYGRRHKVNRDAYGNYYDYGTFSNYEHATNTHRNPRYSGLYPANGYYNGVVYMGTDRPRRHHNDRYYDDCCYDDDDCCYDYDDRCYDSCGNYRNNGRYGNNGRYRNNNRSNNRNSNRNSNRNTNVNSNVNNNVNVNVNNNNNNNYSYNGY